MSATCRWWGLGVQPVVLTKADLSGADRRRLRGAVVPQGVPVVALTHAIRQRLALAPWLRPA